MIKYRLGCSRGHDFESWFQSGAAFDEQVRRQLVTCPVCGSSGVDRLPMAPAVIASAKRPPASEGTRTIAANDSERIMDQLRQMKRALTETSDYVGPAFAKEARKIHFGETENRSIHGEATPEEAYALHEDEIPFSVLPPLPEDQN